MESPARSELTAFIYKRLGWEIRDTETSRAGRIALTDIPALAPIDEAETRHPEPARNNDRNRS